MLCAGVGSRAHRVIYKMSMVEPVPETVCGSEWSRPHGVLLNAAAAGLALYLTLCLSVCVLPMMPALSGFTNMEVECSACVCAVLCAACMSRFLLERERERERESEGRDGD